MKGGKKRNSQEPLPLPPVTAEDGGGEKCADSQRNPPTLLDATEKEGLTQNQKNLGKEAAAVAEGKKPVAVDASAGEEEEEEEEDGGEKGDEHFEDLQIEGAEEPEDAEEEGDGEAERPKLAEGYYEIEAVRKKRVRKVKFLV